MSNTATNLTDITNLSDTVLDAFIAFRAGDNEFSFDHLTRKQLYILQDALGVDLSLWIRTLPATNTPPLGPDFEGLILAREEDI